MNRKLSKEDRIIKTAKLNYKYLLNMIEFFIETSSGKTEFCEMYKNLELAKKVAGDTIIIQYTSKYMLMFKDDILVENEEKLFTYDYTSLIEKDTAGDTDKLIRDIIDGIRSIWKSGDSSVQGRMRNYILKLLKASIKYDYYVHLK